MLSWLVVVGSDLVCRGREKERNRKRGKEGDAEIIEDQKVSKKAVEEEAVSSSARKRDRDEIEREKLCH